MGFQLHVNGCILCGEDRKFNLLKYIVGWCSDACIPIIIHYLFPNFNIKHGENTLLGGQDCCHIVLFFRGPMFELQPCHYYEGFSQCFCILW
jgi:hypothetical protein